MISIIIPTYNRAHLISRAIQSVINQTHTKWELIIVDDGSTDKTEEIITSFKDPRIKYFYTENTGATDSRNFGVSKSIGPYIIFLDSDDEVKGNWLELFCNKIKLEQASLVSCGYEKVDHEDNLISTHIPINLGPFFSNITANFLSGTLLMKKELFEQVGGYDVELTSGHHTDLLIRLIPIIELKELEIPNIPHPLVIIHIHKGSRIRHNSNSLYLGGLKMMEKHRHLFQQHPDDHFDYLSVGGVSAIRIKKFKEGRELLFRALKIKPFRIKSYGRLIISLIPGLRENVWKPRN